MALPAGTACGERGTRANIFAALMGGPNRIVNMMKKIVLAIVVAAVAVSFAPTISHAKKMKKAAAAKCTMGKMMMGQPNSMGWAPVMGCGADGKMYPTLMMCYAPSSFCPPSM